MHPEASLPQLVLHTPPLPMGLAELNGLDWVLLLLAGYSIFSGLRRGILRTLFGLLGVGLGFAIASANYIAAADKLGQWITSFATARIVAFLLIVAAVSLVFTLIGHALRKTAHAAGLGPFDRLLGAAFGAVRGALLGIALLMTIPALRLPPRWIMSSKLASYFLAAAHAVSFVVPHDLQRQIVSGTSKQWQDPKDWIKQD